MYGLRDGLYGIVLILALKNKKIKIMRLSQKIFRFFASDKGRKYVLFGTAGVCLTTFGVGYFPHGLLIDQYREIIASYQ
jgi:hypothetical protein